MILKDLNVILIIFLIYFLTFEPIAGFFLYKSFVRKQKTDNNQRLKYYGLLLFGMWLPTLSALIYLALNRIHIKAAGFDFINLRYSNWFEISILIVSILFFLLIIYQLLAVKFSAKFRQKLMETKLPDDIDIMLPHTVPEKKLWTFISISAGITEEFLYRGFLSFVILQLVPNINGLVPALVSSALFGLGHTYQGISGVIRTGVLGLLFFAIYSCTGSILPGIFLHFLIDLAARDYRRETSVQAESDL